MLAPQNLRSFLIPFEGGQALLPHSLIVKVLSCATPLRLENAPPWVVGSMLWEAFNVPLISLERLLYGAEAEIKAEANVSGYAHVVILNTLSHDAQLPYCGLLGTDAPRLLNLERGDVSPDEMAPSRVLGVAQWVLVKDQPALIPDLDALAAELIPLMGNYG